MCVDGTHVLVSSKIDNLKKQVIPHSYVMYRRNEY